MCGCGGIASLVQSTVVWSDSVFYVRYLCGSSVLVETKVVFDRQYEFRGWFSGICHRRLHSGTAGFGALRLGNPDTSPVPGCVCLQLGLPLCLANRVGHRNNRAVRQNSTLLRSPRGQEGIRRQWRQRHSEEELEWHS